MCDSSAADFCVFKGPVGFPGDPGPPGEVGLRVSRAVIYIVKYDA